MLCVVEGAAFWPSERGAALLSGSLTGFFSDALTDSPTGFLFDCLTVWLAVWSRDARGEALTGFETGLASGFVCPGVGVRLMGISLEEEETSPSFTGMDPGLAVLPVKKAISLAGKTSREGKASNVSFAGMLSKRASSSCLIFLFDTPYHLFRQFQIVNGPGFGGVEFENGLAM